MTFSGEKFIGRIRVIEITSKVIGVALIMHLRMRVIKIETFMVGHLIW